MNFQRIQNINNAWWALAVALALGGLAAWAAKSYLATRVAAIESQAQGQKVSLVVAKRDITDGEVLSADNLAVRDIPVAYAHSGAINPEQFDEIDGQRIVQGVKSGELVLWSLLSGQQPPAFSTVVAVGRRAITVPVDEINSISGLLQPGDFIDLMATIERNGRKRIFPLLQNVKVLATGQKPVNSKPVNNLQNPDQAMVDNNYATVTLDADPQEAQTVIMAREIGKITALLRNPQDKNPLRAIPAQMASLLGAGSSMDMDDTDVAGKSFTNQVPVMYGGQSDIPPEALTLGKKIRLETSQQSPPSPNFQPTDKPSEVLPSTVARH
jgi:pilus assembly protein CpaB